MKQFILILAIFFCASSISAQCPSGEIRTKADTPYGIKCGSDKKLSVQLTTITFPAAGNNAAEDSLKIEIIPFKEYYKNFPEATKQFFYCKNDDCDMEECAKKVTDICISGTDPRPIGGGMYRSIIYVYVDAECKRCGHPQNGQVGGPSDEDCPISMDLECNSTVTASFKFRTKKIAIEDEDAALAEIERLREILKNLFEASPDHLDVTITCHPHGCEPNEVCNSSYTVDDVINPDPVYDGECWSVDFYVTITATCTECMLDDKDPKPRSSEEAKTSIVISPNPADNLIKIEIESDSQLTGETLQVFNLKGQLITELIYQSNIENMINVSNWNDGVYYLLLKKDSQVIIKKSFVISR